ncbi:DMT family transporter [Amaricoccus sp.]|uniref:DMT family transporter n=1 Tax=Amaricoccus sp. TaxID=1872485 RepID=UPI001B6B993C|nr:DMT family transporter [Amaricoccus sp.]MBP7001494.1 DMT family transporter [Amaricoccus sp.]
MRTLILPALAALAGAGIVLQQALNAHLRIALGSGAWSGFVSFLVGVTCMAAFALALRDPVPLVAAAGRLPWWAWCGGVFGAIFVGLGLYLVPVIGAATFFAFLVAGQMAASVAFDHFGWLGVPERPVDLTRLLGAALLVGGVVLLRR